MDQDETCPCGSGITYGDCCGPLHAGAPAASPEALMRSRFSAFVLKDAPYLLKSWYPETRPKDLDLSDAPDWTGLQIFSSDQSGHQGSVHFRAVFRERGQWGYLEETSTFYQQDAHWFYHSGKPEQGLLKPGRNDRCPCGSGRKFKACCLNRTN
ncbi:YchJ family protein [Marinobacter sp. NFXS9]|uniref:YchJ family protein n=1 Tax=Marinobacter sp. NFXS9 TaxID=2818433 RepID=UPI0032DE605F